MTQYSITSISKIECSLPLPAQLDELKNLPVWCMWKREKKNSKVPYSPLNGKRLTGNKGSNEYMNLLSCYTSAESMLSTGQYSGIGIVMPEGYAGSDLDHCIDENGNISPEGKEIVERLNSYTEISPSGHGLRIFMKGSKPGESVKRSDKNTGQTFEIYSDPKGNFLTITGNVYGEAKPIRSDQKAIDWYYKKYIVNQQKQDVRKAPAVPDHNSVDMAELPDDVVLEKLLADPKGEELYNSSGEVDHSADDMGLCNKLAFYTRKNPVQMDRLFRQSNLYATMKTQNGAKKWDVIHFNDPKETYGEHTIRKAISETSEVYSPERYRNDQIVDLNQHPAVKTDPETGEVQEVESDLTKFHRVNKAGIPVSVYDFGIFKYLTERESILICGGVPFIYRNGVFQRDTGSELKTMIRNLIVPELIRSNTIERVYRLFLSASELQVKAEDLNQYPDNWINFRNGFYDPIRRKMIPHDPKYKAVNQLPHDFDPDLNPPGKDLDAWLRFIAPEEDDREMLLQYCGYCMTKDIKQQKFLILCGTGGSGKSTLIRMLENVIGAENISNVSLKELSQRFASYGLMGKLLNSCADLEISALEDTSVLKKILGEDRIRAEQKGKDAVSFRSYAKLIFSANELPLVLSEKTDGFYRRLMILRMNKKPKDRQADYLNHLVKEIDHFIHLCIDALQRMYKNGLISESAGSIKEVQTLWNESDTVEAWINDMMIRDSDGKLDRDFLLNSYQSYCEKVERAYLQRNTFYKALRAKEFSEIKTGGYYYFKGLKVKQ